MGATDEQIDQKREAKRLEAERSRVELVLWPDLEAHWSIFPRCRWEIIGTFGGLYFTGIPTAELETIARLLGVQMTAALLDELRIMESEARSVLNAKVGKRS